jgi:hypothetical protein
MGTAHAIQDPTVGFDFADEVSALHGAHHTHVTRLVKDISFSVSKGGVIGLADSDTPPSRLTAPKNDRRRVASVQPPGSAGRSARSRQSSASFTSTGDD